MSFEHTDQTVATKDPPSSASRRVRITRRSALVGGSTFVAAVVVSRLWVGSEESSQPASSVADSTPQDDGVLTAAEIFGVVQPSMVFIEVARGAALGAEAPSDSTETSAGAEDAVGGGIISNRDGTVLTAFHVVDGADSIEVVFADGTRTSATVASSDPSLDIATLTPRDLPEVVVPAVLGGALQVGDRVVAVGHPFGLVDSVTEGVVSGLDRATFAVGSEFTLSGLVQFDAAVNPGSSGGPLLNDRGEVAGIVTALANPNVGGYFIGIGFAIPIGTAVGAGGGGPAK